MPLFSGATHWEGYNRLDYKLAIISRIRLRLLGLEPLLGSKARLSFLGTAPAVLVHHCNCRHNHFYLFLSDHVHNHHHQYFIHSFSLIMPDTLLR